MHYQKVRAIEEALPENFRLHIRFADSEMSLEMIQRIAAPNQYLILQATRKGFFGFFRGWKIVGQLDAYEDALFIKRSLYDDLFELFHDLLKKNDIDVSIQPGVARSDLKYIRRLENLAAKSGGERLKFVLARAKMNTLDMEDFSNLE